MMNCNNTSNKKSRLIAGEKSLTTSGDKVDQAEVKLNLRLLFKSNDMHHHAKAKLAVSFFFKTFYF